MRKFLIALLLSACTAGLSLAAEVTLVKYDKEKKEVTVKEESGEKTYKLTDKTKYAFTDADGKETTANFAAAEKMLTNEKAPGRTKFDLTADKDAVTAIKLKSRKKKN